MLIFQIITACHSTIEMVCFVTGLCARHVCGERAGVPRRVP